MTLHHGLCSTLLRISGAAVHGLSGVSAMRWMLEPSPRTMRGKSRIKCLT